MNEKTFKTRVIHKHDTEAHWLLATNFIPKKGELIVYDCDKNYNYERLKIGDGVTVVSELPFVDAELETKLDELTDDIPHQISITYSELKSLRDNAQLMEGRFYRITDYVCTTTQENTRAATNQFDIIVRALDSKTLSEVASAIHHEGDTYFADIDLAAWELKYCLDNDTARFAWAYDSDTPSIINLVTACSNGKPLVRQPSFDGGFDGTDHEEYFYAWGTQADVDDGDQYNFVYSKNETIIDREQVYNAFTDELQYAKVSTGKGVIYYMKDEWNNECPYDFKNIQFKRDTDWQNEHTSFIEGLGINVGDVEWFYTFSWINENLDVEDLTIRQDLLSDDPMRFGTHSNRMEQCLTQDAIGAIQLNNNLFIDSYHIDSGIFYGCYSNTFGNNCDSNTFGNNCHSNTFGNDCRDNIFGNDCYSNTFGNHCYFHTFGNACYSNTFGNNCDSNTFGNGCFSNTFGNGCCCNTFGEGCYSNTFGNDCFSNTFGNDCYSNTFGNDCGSNTFGNGCFSNTFGNEYYSNTFGEGCYSNTFGHRCNSNTFGDYCWDNTFGNECNSNTFGDHCWDNTFGNECNSNTFGSSRTARINCARYIRFENGCKYIKLLNTETGDNSNYIQDIVISAGVRGTENAPLELSVSRNAAPVVYEAGNTTHIILD